MVLLKNILLLLIFTILNCQGFSSGLKFEPNKLSHVIENTKELRQFEQNDSLTKKEFNKIKFTAVTLAITLGVFGVHRLYLGTSPKIPIVYTLTLGGGFFVLPLIDIVYIIAAKDINQLRNNDYIFMWNKKLKTT